MDDELIPLEVDDVVEYARSGSEACGLMGEVTDVYYLTDYATVPVYDVRLLEDDPFEVFEEGEIVMVPGSRVYADSFTCRPWPYED